MLPEELQGKKEMILNQPCPLILQVPLSQMIEEKQAKRRETQTENRAKRTPKTFESERLCSTEEGLHAGGRRPGKMVARA